MRVVLPLLALCLVRAVSAQDDKAWEKVRAAYDRGRPYSGIRTCDKMLSGKQPRKEFLVLRAEGRNRIGYHELAMEDAREAVALAAGDVPAAALQLGIAHAASGHVDSARHWFAQAMHGETAMQAHLRTGMLDRVAGRCDDAVQRFDRVLAVRPEDLAALRERGLCRTELGDTAGARLDLDKAIELAPREAVNWNSRGHHLLQVGRYKEAIADFDRAIKLDPNYSFAFNNRGMAHHRLGARDRALRDIGMAARKRRSNPYVYRNLGVIALEEGDGALACKHFRMALDLRFTELHGTEVEELMRAHCAGPPGVAPATEPLPQERKERRSTVPARINAP